MRRTFVCGTVILLFVAAPAHGQASPSASEMIHIDGSKNPELIPQWSAWGFAFRIFSGGPRQLPSPVQEHLSKAEEALIMNESDAVQKIDAACAQRLLNTYKLVSMGESRKDVDLKMHAITIECRWETIRARDRILAGINPEAQIALAVFVEGTKKGTKAAVPKNGLARYLEPQ